MKWVRWKVGCLGEQNKGLLQHEELVVSAAGYGSGRLCPIQRLRGHRGSRANTGASFEI